MSSPISTYRIQLNHSFTFKDLESIVDYLSDLGVTTIYASPITAAVKGSTHGYDVADASVLNPEIGTMQDFEQLISKVKEKKINWIQDIVPNHMAYSFENSKVIDILERGKYSPYYNYFDIDWEHTASPGKVMVPFLGEDLDTYIERKNVKVLFGEEGFKFFCGEQEFPLSASGLSALVPSMHEYGLPSALIHKIEIFVQLSSGTDLPQWLAVKKDFITSMNMHTEYKSVISEFLVWVSSDIRIIKNVIQAQSYLPVCYTITDKCMTYRRFFTINNLICLRMEDEAVCNDYHKLMIELYKKGLIQGFRLDHIDGLYEPMKYIQWLRNKTGEDCYIIAEKILDCNHEDLPDNWCIEGTTGYEFLAYSNRVLTNKTGSEQLLTFYKEFTGSQNSFEEIAYEKKHAFLYKHMLGELTNLMTLYDKLLLKQEDIPNDSLQKAFGIFMAAFPVYRIYPDQFPLAHNEINLVTTAFERSVQKAPDLQKEFNFIKSLFEKSDPQIDERKIRFIKRLMQYTGPLAAKGVEDTTFFIYNPLISHNEVGDMPSPLTYTVDGFHEKMYMRQKKNPRSLNASSTHDTKRAENARARINSISFAATEWMKLVRQWHQCNAAYIQQVNGRSAPSLNDEYFIYQSLLGAFPETLNVDVSFLERTQNFLVKALREAKTETNYDTPDTDYENACIDFIKSILKSDSDFLKTFIPFLNRIIGYATVYSYAEVVLKTTAPGIPDFYQGTELNDLSYVDPDNRRPIDYDLRKRLLSQIQGKSNAVDFIKSSTDSGIDKLFVAHSMLMLRKNYADVFLNGEYISIPNQLNILAYARCYKQHFILVLIPLDFKSDTAYTNVSMQLPDNFPVTWKNIFTKTTIQINTENILSGLSEFPVAVFENI